MINQLKRNSKIVICFLLIASCCLFIYIAKFHLPFLSLQKAPPISAQKTPPISAPPIPEKIISSIVNATLAATNPTHQPTDGEITARTKQVKDFLSSNGGHIWYKNYLLQFNTPINEPSPPPPEFQKNPFNMAFLAEEKAVSEPKLTYYYIHRPLTSADNILKFQCFEGKPLSKGAVLATFRSPTEMAFCGLAYYHAFLFTKQKNYYVEFLKLADLFVRGEKNGRWEWSKDVAARNLKAPWISALTQGVGISLLLRAYQETHDETYLKVAKKAFHWLILPLEQDGTASKTNSGIWYEEYPEVKNPSHILNGHIWALFGIWDYYRVTGDKAAEKMFFDGISVIKTDIDNYDVGYWIVYANTNRVDAVNGSYMAFIVQQMKALYAITNDNFFNEYAEKWDQYQKNDSYFVHLAVHHFLESPFLPKG